MSTENDNNNQLSENFPINENQPENLNNSKVEEKEFLEGEEHNNNKSENQIEPNINEQNDIKKENISKPMSFLKDKMTKMNLSRNILTGINRSMDKQMKNMETDIIEDRILMTEVPKNFNKPSSRSLQKAPILKLSNFEQKNKLKTLKELLEEKNTLNKKLQKITSNEQFLENEGYMQADGSNEKNFSLVDQNIYESKKKLIESKKSDILNKIQKIDDNIKKLVSSGLEITRKERIKNYLENFERDKEIIESRAKKYFKETKERNQRIKNDLNKKVEKLKKEIEDKTKKEEMKKEEFFKRFKQAEKAVIKKRTKENDEKVKKFKSFLKKKLPKDLKNYLFFKKEEEFQKEEQNLVDKENLRRREKMKVDFNEINEFEKNALSYKDNLESENAERKKKLLLEWKERKNTLPTYVSPLKEELEKENEIDEEKNKKQQNKELKLKKQAFGYNIKNNLQPEINEKLRKQRNNLIKSIENPRLVIKERLLIQRQKKAEELLSEQENKKGNKSMKKLKLKITESDSVKKLNNSSNITMKINLHSNSNKKLFSPVVFPLHPRAEKKIDYLTELRQKKKKSPISSEKTENYEEMFKNNNIKWEKALNNDKGSIIENINYLREKTRVMDDEVKQKEILLKLNGGVQNNVEIGQKLSNLIIDSIEAKLTILNKFNN